MRKFKEWDTPSVISEELKAKVSDFTVRLCHVDPTPDSVPSAVIDEKGLDFTSTGFVSVVGGVSYVSIRVDYEASVASRITLTLKWSGEQDRALSQVISPLHRESKLGLDFHVKEFVSLFMTACKL